MNKLSITAYVSQNNLYIVQITCVKKVPVTFSEQYVSK